MRYLHRIVNHHYVAICQIFSFESSLLHILLLSPCRPIFGSKSLPRFQKSGLRAKSVLYLSTLRNCVQIQKYINKSDFIIHLFLCDKGPVLPGASKHSDVRNNNSLFILFRHCEAGASQRLEGRRWWMEWLILYYWLALSRTRGGM